MTAAEDIEETTRFVVGPDEPFGGCSLEDMERDHWAYLAGILRQQGVAANADDAEGPSARRRAQRAGACAPRSVTQRHRAGRNDAVFEPGASDTDLTPLGIQL